MKSIKVKELTKLGNCLYNTRNKLENQSRIIALGVEEQIGSAVVIKIISINTA